MNLLRYFQSKYLFLKFTPGIRNCLEADRSNIKLVLLFDDLCFRRLVPLKRTTRNVARSYHCMSTAAVTQHIDLRAPYTSTPNGLSFIMWVNNRSKVVVVDRNIERDMYVCVYPFRFPTFCVCLFVLYVCFVWGCIYLFIVVVVLLFFVGFCRLEGARFQ